MIDASGKVLGKIATTAATVLTGKRKPIYTPFLDTGDHVVVINADQVVLTGQKETDKIYRRHSGYLGGLKSRDGAGRAPGAPGADRRGGRPGDAAQDQARARDVPEAEGLPRRQAPAPGAEAAAAQPVAGAREALSTTPLEYYGTGKRKTSVARVHLRPGTGEFQLNERGLDEYFGGLEALKQIVKQPFSVTETNDRFDVVATIHGGGVAAQAGAIRHGISRALCEFNARAARQAQEGRLPDPRRAHQGAQEVRTEGRPRPVPVQQALSRFTSSPARGRKAPGAARARG